MAANGPARRIMGAVGHMLVGEANFWTTIAKLHKMIKISNNHRRIVAKMIELDSHIRGLPGGTIGGRRNLSKAIFTDGHWHVDIGQFQQFFALPYCYSKHIYY
jgi:hypothetical protein